MPGTRPDGYSDSNRSSFVATPRSNRFSVRGSPSKPPRPSKSKSPKKKITKKDSLTKLAE